MIIVFLTLQAISLLSFQPVEAQQEIIRERKITYLSVDEFNYRFYSEVYAFIIDARSKAEYKSGRIGGALNVSNRKDLDQMADTLDHETPLYLYCTAKTRSSAAAEHLKELGFVNLYVLDSGMKGWKEADLPVEKKSKRK